MVGVNSLNLIRSFFVVVFNGYHRQLYSAKSINDLEQFLIQINFI